MTGKKWQQVKQVFQSALEHAPDQREVFLADACADDAGLRREVEILLVSLENADEDHFMQQAPIGEVAEMMVDAESKLEIGQWLDRYKIIALIGAGGMGEVYLAEDKKLDRKVAVKILNEKFSRDESNLNRFIQEAKAASSLNHPNILVIYEIGESDGAHYIVSEFIIRKNRARDFQGKTFETVGSFGHLDSNRRRTLHGARSASGSPRHQARKYNDSPRRLCEDSGFWIGKAR